MAKTKAAAAKKAPAKKAVKPAKVEIKLANTEIPGKPEELQQLSNSMAGSIQNPGPDENSLKSEVPQTTTDPKDFVQVVCNKCQYSNDVQLIDIEQKSQVFCHNCKDELSSQVESTTTTGKERTGISVVIPFLASAAKGEELRYALRGWAENFEDCHIIIIGDRPDFISDEVIYMPAAVSHKSPQLDVTHKIMQSIASDLVTEDFILTNDDIYLVNFTELAELAELKSAGVLGLTKRNSSQGYQELLNLAMNQLRAARYPINDYATHTPLVYNKEKMGKVIVKYDADRIPSLISCLYFNSVFPKAQPKVIKGDEEGDFVGYVYRSSPNTEVLRHAFDNRKIINHNNDGYESVLPFLQEIFPDKCRFEL